MAMQKSILKSTKKILGLDENYGAFDLDVITHINATFFTLYQLGVGPVDGFAIEDDAPVWEDFTEGDLNLNAVQTYVYLSVRLLFDPPGTPHHISALKEQKTELEARIQMEREEKRWQTPSLLPFLP